MSALIYDRFTTSLTAGNVNNTNAEPGPGTRGVIDLSSRVTIDSGYAKIVGDGSNSHEGIWNKTGITREYGRTAYISFRSSNLSSASALGFAISESAATLSAYGSAGIVVTNTDIRARGAATATSAIIYESPAINTDYKTAIVLRDVGRFVFFWEAVNGWKLRHIDSAISTTPLYVGAMVQTANQTVWLDSMIVPSRLYTISATASDSFIRENSATLGTTDGAGHAEMDSGDGKTWTIKSGSIGITNNAAVGSGIATVDCASTGQIVGCKLTRSGNNVGVILRYVDADNYIAVYHDGTNVITYKMVAGSGSTVNSTAVTYSAGATLLVYIDGTRINVVYNATQVYNGTITDASLQTSTLFGLYSTNNSNTFSDFVTFNTSGYSDLDNAENTTKHHYSNGLCIGTGLRI